MKQPQARVLTIETAAAFLGSAVSILIAIATVYGRFVALETGAEEIRKDVAEVRADIGDIKTQIMKPAWQVSTYRPPIIHQDNTP